MSIGVKVTERGWPGHYYLAIRCGFRRNTLLQYKDVAIVVSTIGDQRDKDGIPQMLGEGYYYETAVFKAEQDGPYLDANVLEMIDVKGSWKVHQDILESDLEANDMHERIVNEIKERILKGEFNVIAESTQSSIEAQEYQTQGSEERTPLEGAM